MRGITQAGVGLSEGCGSVSSSHSVVLIWSSREGSSNTATRKTKQNKNTLWLQCQYLVFDLSALNSEEEKIKKNNKQTSTRIEHKTFLQALLEGGVGGKDYSYNTYQLMGGTVLRLLIHFLLLPYTYPT